MSLMRTFAERRAKQGSMVIYHFICKFEEPLEYEEPTLAATNDRIDACVVSPRTLDARLEEQDGRAQ